MKILITGGGGFLGSHLGDAFLARGDDVVALDIAPDYKVQHNLAKRPRFRYVKGSVFDIELLETLMRKCDICYHLAAVVGVEHYVGDPLHVLDVNVNGTQNVLKVATRNEVKVIFSSTSEVYGKSKDIPFREDGDRLLGAPRIDRWCYSTSKAVGEHFCHAYERLGLQQVIVRFFNAYGPRLDKLDMGRVITIFMGQILRGEPITVVGDGKQTRCFTYVEDSVAGLVQAGLRPEAVGGTFNIGTDRETTILELAETMLKISGSKAGVRHVTQEQVYGSSYEDVPRRVPDITRMRSVLGVDPSTTLEDGIRKTIDWFRKEIAAKPALLAAAR